jgi:hypothetical protein
LTFGALSQENLKEEEKLRKEREVENDRGSGEGDRRLQFISLFIRHIIHFLNVLKYF